MDAVWVLLEARACTEAVGCVDQDAATPLIAAIGGREPGHPSPDDHRETVRLLLEANADPSFRGEVAHTLDHDPRPLVAACQGGHLEVVRRLLEASCAGAAEESLTVHPRNPHLAPALVAASSAGFQHVAELLMEAEGRQAMPGTESEFTILTPLLVASLWGHVEVVRLLLEGRADSNIVCGPTGATALSVAAGQGEAEVVELLLAADPSQPIASAQGKGGEADCREMLVFCALIAFVELEAALSLRFRG